MGQGRTLDGLARDLASGQISRRAALSRLAGAAVGVGIATVPGAAALAESGSKRCPKSRRCDGKCCPRHAKCKRGKCKCVSGYTKCGKKCCPTQTCGNGVLDPGEDCDGNDLGGADCSTVGFAAGGTLACTPDCTYDTSGCIAEICGDGLVTGSEECDDGNFSAGDGCGPDCKVEPGWQCVGEPSDCSPICGDGLIVSGEACDGVNLGGETCVSQGFSGGTLACSSDCMSFDTSNCTN